MIVLVSAFVNYGTVSGCSCAIPEPFVEVYRQYSAGNLEAAQKAQRRACDVVRALRGGSDMSVFKNVLTMRGVPAGGMRKPLLALSDDDVARLRKEVAPYI